MGNLRRYYEKNNSYFVTTATHERKELFLDKKLSRILLVSIEYHKTVFDYDVYGYCLMPDHLHLILKPTGSFNLSFIMKMVKGSFSRKVNKLNNQEGSLWQRRFFEETIKNEKQLLSQLEYMHNNPVKAGLVTHPGKYSYSSFGQYHDLRNPEGILLEIDKIQ
jgi:putative transposase